MTSPTRSVWCLFDYRELDAVYSTRDAAQAALVAAKGDHVLTDGAGREITGYHIAEFPLDPTEDVS